MGLFRKRAETELEGEIRHHLHQGLLLAALGVAIGAPLVWFGAKYVQKELFQMKPLEPGSISTALAILSIAALFAVAIPAIRASALRPSDTLRQE